ncbi:SOS response-associated peptidase [Gracilimonas sp.]|uniref:SOS response-associated peptidase n=1 Tax=Gracilimonas sp. TaxID=1974203 RepID=UPI00287178A3|nr:SOS response-associated peptidase [Gracilimonas sp.]
MERYVLEADKYIIEDAFGVSSDSEAMYQPNYNVMPGHTMPIILQEGDNRNLVKSIWGLKPKSQDEELVEIPQEDVLEDDLLAGFVKSGPCIIPASGFYKWKETVKDPLPFYLRVLTNEVAGFAGIYTEYEDDEGKPIHAFAVLTMKANALVEPLDDRMPVILQEKEYDVWLNGDGEKLLKKGFSGDMLLPEMSVFRVPELVNDPSNNSKELIQPIPKLRNYDGAEEDE